MKNIHIFSIIVIIISFILAFYIVINTNNKPTESIESYKATIDSAQNNIDSLKAEIVKSDIVIDSLHKEIVILDSTNVLLKGKIIKIKQELNEKIDGVDILTNDELGKFLTERYKYQR